MKFLGTMLQGLASIASVSQTFPLESCKINGLGSGSISVAISKSGTHTGIAKGDQMTLVFDKCDIDGTGYVFNGTAKVTAQNAVASGPSAVLNVGFETNFGGSVGSGGLTTTYQGFSVNYAGVVDSILETKTSSEQISSTVPSAQVFSLATSGNHSVFLLSYNAGTTFVMNHSTGAGVSTLKIDGDLTLGTVGAVIPLTISMPTALSGPTSASGEGSFVASAGVINARMSVQDLSIATSTTFNGAMATISGDTDNNGTMDMSFTSTWTLLTTRPSP